MSPRIVIAGAGIGGLSAAIRLASRGHRVTVVEQLDRPGGKMGEVREAGFRWDTGPSVITMRSVYERLFSDAGRDLNDYVELLPMQPITRYFWRDGATIDAVANQDEMCENIQQAFGRREADGYRRFMAYAQRLHDIVSGPFLHRAKPRARDLLTLPLTHVIEIDALRTMHQAVRGHFRDPHLIQLFDRFATYAGSSPYRAPATLNVIAHVEMVGGVWYPRGGVYQLAKAYERLAAELGVEICYGNKIAAIDITSGRADGLRMSNGERIQADAVISNIDHTQVQTSMLTGIPDKGPPRTPRPPEPSCSGFTLLLGVRGIHPALTHHNVFFNEDYRREFDDIFDRKIAPRDPTLYLCITSKTDLEHAPAGRENWHVLVNAPYLSDAFDWPSQAQRYARHIKGMLIANVDRLSTLTNAQTMLEIERAFTPSDIQAHYGGNRGAIYGHSSNTRRAAFLRPSNRDGRIERLYYAGGSAHPGGGVPLVTLSGCAAANCVMDDLLANK
jgi:phytoene desaturase